MWLRWPKASFGPFEAGFLVLVAAALTLRLWDLDGRTMHYDEAIHVHFAWKLFQGKEFIHSPWMHGPFQVELVSLIFRIFGDTEFTARLGYALFGSALVGLPYFLREALGKPGALITGVMLALSPNLLYFSRFGRNDIIMAFWATDLLVLFWRYIQHAKHRYLYIASALIAFMFATKETAYMTVLIFGFIMFLLALPDLVPWALGRVRLSQLTGAAGVLLLLVTLTLPQWAAIAGLAQDALGLDLVNRNGVSGGIVGAPQWGAPYVAMPVYLPAWWLHALAASVTLLAAGGLALLHRSSLQGARLRPLIFGLVAPAAGVVAVSMAMLRPLGQAWPSPVALAADFCLAALAIGAAVTTLAILRVPWKRGVFWLLVPALGASVYLVLFTLALDVTAVVDSILPDGVNVDTTGNVVPVNFLVAGGLLGGALGVSIFLGVRWLGGPWLGCAGIFYVIWVGLYTIGFEHFSGVFSGVWQGMGYWIAQQDVGRGNQPWYYYFVGLSVYELLPVVFGLWGGIHFLRRGDVFGLILVVWSGATLIAYTLASEKMPWLLVNLTLPIIFLAGKFLGDLAEQVRWRELLRRGQGLLLILPPAAVTAAVSLVYLYSRSEGLPTIVQWALLLGGALLALLSAWLVRLARPPSGAALAGLSVAALLLIFGTVGSFRAAYIHDDRYKELLVYAQGSTDVAAAYRDLDRQVFQGEPEAGGVSVDYDLWYPGQWYARRVHDVGVLKYSCFKDDSEDGWNDSCKTITETPDSQALLLSKVHGGRDNQVLLGYQRQGPLRDLLWFPETYRRPHENRQDEGSQWGLRGIPSTEQLAKDFRFFLDVATSRDSWRDILAYILFRDLEKDWFNSEFYSYVRS